MPSLRKWLLSGLLVLAPLIITLWVLEWVVSTLDLTLHILPNGWHPDKLFGVHIPGLGVIFALLVVLTIGALGLQLHRQPPGQLVACAVAPHSRGALDLFGREAGIGYPVFREGQCLSQGVAGGVAARRHVDHRIPDGHRLRVMC